MRNSELPMAFRRLEILMESMHEDLLKCLCFSYWNSQKLNLRAIAGKEISEHKGVKFELYDKIYISNFKEMKWNSL